jgi:hypothetical protein
MRIPQFNIIPRNAVESEVDEELQFHLEMLESKFAQVGMGAPEARAAALRRFGNVERIKKQCVDISKRNGLLRRVLKISLLLVGLIGLAIRVSTTELHISRVGTMLIMIAIFGRLLLYVRGLSAFTYLAGVKPTSLPVITRNPEDGSNLREV